MFKMKVNCVFIEKKKLLKVQTRPALSDHPITGHESDDTMVHQQGGPSLTTAETNGTKQQVTALYL